MQDRIVMIHIKVIDHTHCHPECPGYYGVFGITACTRFAVAIENGLRPLECHDAETAMAALLAKLVPAT